MSSSELNTQDTPVNHSANGSNAKCESFGNTDVSDDACDLVRIVVTLQDKKIEMVKDSKGNWSDWLPVGNTPKTKKKNPFKRRIGNARLYAEMTRRKKRFQSTAFGRLRRRHKQEMYQRSYRRMDLKQGIRQVKSAGGVSYLKK